MSVQHIQSCFQAFDKDNDGVLNLEEFGGLCKALFRNDRGFVYDLGKAKVKDMFEVFDRNHNDVMEIEEFTFCWYNWFKYIIHPRCVCIVVNMQNDYISGAMALTSTPTEEEQELPNVIEPINGILGADFDKVFYVYDWHPMNHISFFENINLRPIHPTSKFTAEDAKLFDTVIFAIPTPYEQKLWPKHCVENTWGSELHPDLKITSNSSKVYTGANPESDQFSAFRDSDLTANSFQSELHKMSVTDIYVVGIAYDLCVRETCLDALNLGYRTVLVEDCCRAFDPDVAEQTKKEIISRNGVVVNSQHVRNMTEGKDRRAELGYMLAMRIKTWVKKQEIRSSLRLFTSAATKSKSVEGNITTVGNFK